MRALYWPLCALLLMLAAILALAQAPRISAVLISRTAAAALAPGAVIPLRFS